MFYILHSMYVYIYKIDGNSDGFYFGTHPLPHKSQGQSKQKTLPEIEAFSWAKKTSDFLGV